MTQSSYLKCGVYAILCREHIIYIGMTQASFLSRWFSHIRDSFGGCKNQKELHTFIKNHKKDIRFQELLNEEEIVNIGITVPQAEKILIGWYNPIFNQKEVLYQTRNDPMYSIEQVVNRAEKVNLTEYSVIERIKKCI